MTDEQLKEVRRTYLLARAVNTQYQFIREFVNDDLRKAINEAKAKNAYFIKSLLMTIYGKQLTKQKQKMLTLLKF